MSMLKSARCFPGEGNSRTFAAPSGADLVPPAPAAFALSGNLPDLGAAAFAASEGWLPPGMAAFAPPPPPAPSSAWPQGARRSPDASAQPPTDPCSSLPTQQQQYSIRKGKSSIHELYET
jgi:hypothetical protein